MSGEGSAAPKRLPRAVREQQMLDAAVAIFARHGYHAASMEHVAERAGISKPMLYLYLGSKEDLFLACIRREAGRVVEAVSSVLDASLPPDRQLWRGLCAFYAHVAQHRDAWTVLHEQAPAHGDPFATEVANLRDSFLTVVTDLFRRAVADRGTARSRRHAGDITAMAHAFVGACEAVADWAVTEPAEPAERTAARLMNFTWLGLDSLLRGQRWQARD